MPRSFVSVRSGVPALMLPLGVEIRAVAREGSSAALALLRGSGWGKRELAAWLVGRYRPLVAFAAHAPLDDTQEFDPAPPSLGKTVEPAALADVLRDAKGRALRVIETALRPDDRFDAAWAALERSCVVPAEDCMGEPGFLPVDRRRMRLGHRVVSLLLSHRLTSPDEFESTWSALPSLREELDVDERWTRTA